MSRLIIRLSLLCGWLALAAGALHSTAQAGPWVSAMALPVAGASFFWGSVTALGLAFFSLVVSLGLSFQGASAYGFAGAWVLFGALPLALWAKRREFYAKRLGLDAQRLLLQQSSSFHARARDAQCTVLREQEKSIQEISELYGLSKELLATLDLNEAMQITDDALLRWMPHLDDNQRIDCLKEIRMLVERGTFSLESLVRTMPLVGSDLSVRERWGMVSGQLALGLQRVSLYRQVQESATHDGLTGLLVRRYFRQRLEEESARSSRRVLPLVFLMVDLDHFKQVNDRYGHLVGDVVLREVANRIQNSVREIDLVARYGGEEFAVALPDAELALGTQIADRIRLSVEEQPIRAYDEEVRMTVSIGASLCTGERCNVNRLIDEADQAMYQAKTLGRNRTVATPIDPIREKKP